MSPYIGPGNNNGATKDKIIDSAISKLRPTQILLMLNSFRGLNDEESFLECSLRMRVRVDFMFLGLLGIVI